MKLEERKTPGGRDVLYSEVGGQVSGDDARVMLERLKQMNRGEPKPCLLSVVAKDTKYSAESQRVFTKDFEPYYDRLATVVTSSIVRAAINFMVRIGGNAMKVRMCESEEAALKWLDEER